MYDRNPLSEVNLTIQKTLSYLKDHGHITGGANQWPQKLS